MAKIDFWELISTTKWRSMWDLYHDLKYYNATYKIQLLTDGRQLFVITRGNTTHYYFLFEGVKRGLFKKHKVYYLV